MFLSFKFFKFKKSLNLVRERFKNSNLERKKILRLPWWYKNKKRFEKIKKKSLKKISHDIKMKKEKVLKKVLPVNVEKQNKKNLNKYKSTKKNMHKALYDERPFLKRERWPRKWRKLIAKWRFKKVGKKNKNWWLKAQKKKMRVFYRNLKKKFKNKLTKKRFVRKNLKNFRYRYVKRRVSLKGKEKNEGVLSLDIIKKKET